LGFLQPVFWVVILLGVMILVHELGHFWAALAVGVKVETFSIGFGPRIWGFHRGDTDFRLSAIPFGGYVRMLGEQAGDENAIDPQSFQAKARWQRAVVIIAGPLMNIILAIGIVTGLYMYEFRKEIDTKNPVITSVKPDSAAAQAGFQGGDRILQFADEKNPNWDYLIMQEALNANHEMNVTVDRHGQVLTIPVTPRMDQKTGLGSIGWVGEQNVQIGDIQQGSPAQAAGLKPGDLFLNIDGQAVASPLTVQQAVIHSGGRPIDLQVMRSGQTREFSITPIKNGDSKLPFRIGVSFRLPVEIVKLSFPQAFTESLKFNRQNALMIFQMLGSIIERRVSPKSVSGPIGIAVMSNEAAQQGPWMYLLLMALVSLNLAIFNLLPIPILDGGTLLLLAIEMLLQREVSMRIKETVFKLGFVFLMMIVVFVIYNDISKILTKI
jgi:regulator of sigma E protease